MLRALAAGARRCIRTMSAMTTTKPEVVFILGGPGAGKGTLCRYIVERYGYVHLSAGDLLREERVKPGSEYGELIETHIRNGTIVPVEITCSLIDRAMQTSGNPHCRFLIDGFPRNQDNLDGWNKMMADKVILKGVIFCECNQEVCTRRCLNRGASGSGRSDDNEESLVLRHQTYLKNTLPIIEMYDKQGLVYNVNSMKTPEEVFHDVAEYFPKIGCYCLQSPTLGEAASPMWASRKFVHVTFFDYSVEKVWRILVNVPTSNRILRRGDYIYSSRGRISSRNDAGRNSYGGFHEKFHS